MNHLNKRAFALFAQFWLIPAITFAQDEQCFAPVQAAFTTAAQMCSTTGNNQACFGSGSLNVQPQEGIAPYSFSQPGDLISAREIQTLQSTPLENGSYGVTLLRLQTGAPDNQTITLLAFGDVELHNLVNAADVPPTLDVWPTGSMNIRSGPSTDDALIGVLDAGDTVTANGRLGDNSWLRVTLPDGGTGWLFASLVRASGDINTLDIVDSAGAPVVARYGPMQSFTFRSGVADAPCSGAPESGILLQTSEETTLSINGAEIHLNGTAFLQARSELAVNSLEGIVRVGALDVAHVLTPGMLARVPLDNGGLASAGPASPEPYDASVVQALPLGNLERAITIAPSLSPGQIAAAGIPTAGDWVTTYSVLTYDCQDGRTDVEDRFRSNPLAIQVEQDGAAITLLGTQQRDDPPFAPVTLPRIGAGYYAASVTLENAFGRQSQYEFTLYVLSPTRMEGVTLGSGGDCTTTGSFTADFVAG